MLLASILFSRHLVGIIAIVFKRLKKMALFTGFPASATKSTSGKQGEPCRRGSKNKTGIYDSPIPRRLLFLNTPKRLATILKRTRSSLIY